MGRITKWGCDKRGRQVVPALLGRGYLCRRDRRKAEQIAAIAAEIPEPVDELPPFVRAVIMPAPSARMASGCFPVQPEDAPAPIDDAEEDPDQDLDEDGEQLLEQLRQATRRAPIDLSRFIAASRAKPEPAAPAPRKLEPAQSPEECRRCGIPGRKGCAHQLPYEAEQLTARRYEPFHSRKMA